MKTTNKDLDLLVVKSNSLINAKSKYKYTLNELKLICNLIANVSKNDKGFDIKEMNLQDLGFSDKDFTNHTYLNELCNSILIKPFVIPGTKKWVNWFSMLEPQNGIIRYRFVEDLIPFLLDLKENFTSYYLQNVLKLRSSYSIMIYEILKQMEKVEFRKMNIEDLKTHLNLSQGYQNRDVNVLLKQVQKDLKNNTDISFTYTFEKQSRQFKYVLFKISKQENPQNSINTKVINFAKSIREKFVNKEIIEVNYKGKNEILSVSEKGELYFLTNTFVKFSNPYAKKVWAMLYENREKIEGFPQGV